MILTDKEIDVIRNIIGAVETGGQVYGAGDYADFTPAYANSNTEHSITIGKYQYYGEEARGLIVKIRKADPDLFKKLDTVRLSYELNEPWTYKKILKGSEEAKCIQKIISSEVGKKVQDEVMNNHIKEFSSIMEKKGLTDHQAICMAINWYHQAQSSVDRILAKTKKPYTLDNLYAACKTDTGNQVGAYKSRQLFVYNALKEHWPDNNTLKRGSKGKEVKELQKTLIDMGYDCGSAGVDGDFGKRTESAVKLFQSVNDLNATGIYDSTTKEKVLENKHNQIYYNGAFAATFEVYGASALYFRKDAGKQNDVIGVIGEGERVTCNGNYKVVDGTNWYSITYNSKRGYSSSKYLVKI